MCNSASNPNSGNSEDYGESPPLSRKLSGAAADGERAAPLHPATAGVCVLCGAAMYARHCKRVCPKCGYIEDCSDLFA
jgi:hypothetical protein